MDLKEEKKLWKKGFKGVVGLDEAGRGPLAGPVVAAAVTINPKFEYRNSKKIRIFQFPKPQTIWKIRISNLGFVSDFGFRASNFKIRDSKKLSPKEREKIYKFIIKNPKIKWGIGRVSEKLIDKINILNATKLAMKRAIKNLSSKIKIQKTKLFLIIDGNFKLDLPISQKSIVRADEKIFSCALASILAKVKRDKMMIKYHKKYPEYGFDRHKGYPTKFHRKMIKKYGISKIHRKSFKIL